MSTQYTLTITNDGNEAFQHGEENAEVVRIMRHVASRLEAGYDPIGVVDVNGARVGSFTIEEV